MSTDRQVHPDQCTWVAAVYGLAVGGTALGAGVLIDQRRVLTCAHVILRDDVDWDNLWIAFPFAASASGQRCRVERVGVPGNGELDRDRDVAVLELADLVPAEVTAARLKCPPAQALVGARWWAFGFPPALRNRGDSLDGVVGSALPLGWIRIDVRSQRELAEGFSGGGLWSPDYRAVVGLVAEAGQMWNGTAITLNQADACLPEAGLRRLAEQFHTTDSGEQALTAWGWALAKEPEGRRHWLPRSRGVSVSSEPGYRFRGRSAALQEIKNWLDRDQPDRLVLVVTGDPGSGKSAVLGRIVTTADADAVGQLPASDTAVRASLGSVACAVHAKDKTALEIATEIAEAASAALPERIDDFAHALRDALAEHGGRRFNVIIDALDEAAEPRMTIRSVILPLSETCGDVGAQVIVGSRRRDSEGDLLSAIGARRRLVDLDDQEFFAKIDLTSYALATLRLVGDKRIGNPYGEDASAVPLAERIAELSGRNFLIAGLVARTHGLYDETAIDPAALSFTATVDATMQEYLERVPAVAGVSAQALLTALAFAETPGLPAELWQETIRVLGLGELQAAALTQFARSSAANLLVESVGGTSEPPAFRLFHQALNDALLRARSHLADRSKDERLLATAFIAAGRRVGWDHAPAYLLRSLPAHAVGAGMVDDLLADDAFLLHADLGRLLAHAGQASSATGGRRAKLLRLSPHANSASPASRAAHFSVTEALESLGDTYQARDIPQAPYRTLWGFTKPRIERSVFKNHGSAVNSICTFTRAGTVYLASGSDDGEVWIWDVAANSRQSIIKVHSRVTSLCAFALRGRTLLAVGASDGIIRIWDPATNTQHSVLEGHDRTVKAISTLNFEDRTLLATGGVDRMIRIWDPAAGNQVSLLSGHDGWIQALCTVDENNRPILIAGDSSGHILVWDPVTGDLLARHHSHVGAIKAVSVFLQRGRVQVAIAGGSRVVPILDLAAKSEKSQLSEHDAWVNSVCTFTNDHQPMLATAGDDGILRVWDPDLKRPRSVLRGHTGKIKTLCAFTQDHLPMLATGSTDGTVRIWDPIIVTKDPPPDTEAGTVGSVCTFRVNGRPHLAASGKGGKVIIWDLADGKQRSVLSVGEGWISSICAFTVRERTFLAIGINHSEYLDGSLRVWDPEACAWHRNESSASIGAVCTFTRDGRTFLAIAKGTRTVLVSDAATGRQEYEAFESMDAVHAICAIDLNGSTWLAMAANMDRSWQPPHRGTLRVWNPIEGAERTPLEGHSDWITAVCSFSLENCTFLASSSDDNTVRIWDPTTGAEKKALRGHTKGVNTVCSLPLPNGQALLISGGYDETVRIWDPLTTATVLTIPVHHAILSLDYLSNFLAVGTTAGVLVIWLNLEGLGRQTKTD